MPVPTRRRGADSGPVHPVGLARWCARVTRSRPFEAAIVVLIMANAAVLGVETYRISVRPARRCTGWK
ncbi:hypothetical protein [Micromonospora sp. WMMD708]|uniref:hypothetical protein n=1 Tax=Micromonospora sp. WMMD708 TaxID=3403464 RepID=UPI003BF51B15